MIQVRDEIECGETTDANGLRWKKYRPGPVRIIDEAETKTDEVRSDENETIGDVNC